MTRFGLIPVSQLASGLTFLHKDVWCVSFSLSSSLCCNLGNYKVKGALWSGNFPHQDNDLEAFWVTILSSEIMFWTVGWVKFS